MDGLSLFRAARALGLSVTVDGDRLVVRGPAAMEPVARALLANKGAAIAALRDAELRGVATDWPEDARRHFVNAAGTFDSIRSNPGSRAWDIAVAEANRVAAKVPIPEGGLKELRLIDHALSAFAPMGGLKLDSIVKRARPGPPGRTGAAKQSSPSPSNPD